MTSAVPDAAGETLTISGGNFSVVGGRFGTRPFVTLDLIPLDVRASTDSAILVAVPVGAMPAGKYLLTVSRGPAPTDNASLEVTLGTASPSQSTAVGSAQHNPPGAGATPEAAKALADSLPSSVASTGPAAQVGDHKISIEDVDREWRRSNPSSYLQALRQLYEARREVLNTMVSDELLAREAASRGISVEALLAEEIPKRVIAMPDSAVASLFLSMGDNVRGATLDQMRPALRAWLERHSEPELAKMSYIEELKKVSTRAEILLDAPRVQVEHTAQDISIGPLTAPVELVAFGDFQSDDYARFAQVFPRIRDTFGDRIRLTFKNLPTLGPAIGHRCGSGIVRERARQILGVSRCAGGAGRRRRRPTERFSDCCRGEPHHLQRLCGSPPVSRGDTEGARGSGSLRYTRESQLPRQRPAGASAAAVSRSLRLLQASD